MGSSIGAPIAGAVLASFTATFVVGKSAVGSPIYEVLPSAGAFQYALFIAVAVFVGIAVILAFGHEVIGKRSAPGLQTMPS